MDKEYLVHIDVDDIAVVEGRNKRFDLGDIKELAESIEERGFEEPIKLQRKGDVNELINGHRRIAACKLLKEKYKGKKIPLKNNFPITAPPARFISEEEDEVEILIRMVISNAGKPFLPLEEAMMYKQLKENAKFTTQELAKKVGKSVAHVSDRLALLNADDTVKDAVQDGDITPSDAVTVVRKSRGDKEKQSEIIERVQKEGPGVIQKELLKGRLKKDQWDTAEKVYEDFVAARMHPDLTLNGKETKIETLLEELLQNPDYELVFNLGRVSGVGALTNLTTVEILNKVNDRLNGVADLFE